MLIAAFLVTAVAGMVVGIWLAARAAKDQMPINPIRMWAFIDTMKKKTIESYSEELITALKLKVEPEQHMTSQEIAAFIEDYTKNILEHETTRR